MVIPLHIKRRHRSLEYYYRNVLSEHIPLVRFYTKYSFTRLMCDSIALKYVMFHPEVTGDNVYRDYSPIFMEMYQERIGDAFDDLIKR